MNFYELVLIIFLDQKFESNLVTSWYELLTVISIVCVVGVAERLLSWEFVFGIL